MSKRAVGIIPARYGSTRFPGKPLALIAGKPMLQHVYERALRAEALDEVIVATDDERIADVVRNAGGKAVMTAVTHQSGTDRVNEVAVRCPCSHVVNVQGDEPGIPSKLLRTFSNTLKQINDNSLLTVVSHATIEEKTDPNTVKAVLDRNNRALYFSRACIPYERNGTVPFFKHIGIYGYTVAGLRRFCSFPEGILERVERLEQLRALENGMNIECLPHDFKSVGIDTPEALENYRRQVTGNGYGA